MLHCIAYDIKDSNREEAFLKQLKELGETNQFISNCWFLNCEKSKDDIYKNLRTVLEAPDLLFICGTRTEQMAGWLPSNSIDWLKGQQS